MTTKLYNGAKIYKDATWLRVCIIPYCAVAYRCRPGSVAAQLRRCYHHRRIYIHQNRARIRGNRGDVLTDELIADAQRRKIIRKPVAKVIIEKPLTWIGKDPKECQRCHRVFTSLEKVITHKNCKPNPVTRSAFAGKRQKGI